MYVKNSAKDIIKLSLKYLIVVDLDFCMSYLKNTKFNPVTYLTATKIFLVYPVNCCLNYTHKVNNTIHTGIPCIFRFINNNKNFFT